MSRPGALAESTRNALPLQMNGRDLLDETRLFLSIRVETCRVLIVVRPSESSCTMIIHFVFLYNIFHVNDLQAGHESMSLILGFLFLVAQFLAASGDHVILDNMVRLAF